jgi:hypothetical protein
MRKGYRKRANYFLISIFEHVTVIEVKSDSGKVGENWVRKAYGWDSVELETCKVVQG